MKSLFLASCPDKEEKTLWDENASDQSDQTNPGGVSEEARGQEQTGEGKSGDRGAEWTQSTCGA